MSSHPLDKRRILVVEDEYFLATDLEHDLSRAGATVIGPVPSVERAMALIVSEPAIDAAILDVNLDGRMSFPVADALEARGIPFLFATGYSDGGLEARYPLIVRCEKPFDFRTLELSLCSVLRD